MRRIVYENPLVGLYTEVINESAFILCASILSKIVSFFVWFEYWLTLSNGGHPGFYLQCNLELT